jgi:hypothetical protein
MLPASTTDLPVARPLAALVPLIRQDLDAAKEAAASAGLPYYKAAGEKLLEAKGQLPHGEFKDWVGRNFTVGYAQASLYMKMVDATRALQKSSRDENAGFASLQDFRRKNTGYKQTVHPQPWHKQVKEAVGKVNVEKLKQDALARADEKALQRKLALSLIDIGYKALATKLHPDKGGSREAMIRLNSVRDLLKKAVG